MLKLKELLKNNRGQGLTEYIMILVVVSLSAVGLTQSLGKNINGALDKANKRVRTNIVFDK